LKKRKLSEECVAVLEDRVTGHLPVPGNIMNLCSCRTCQCRTAFALNCSVSFTVIIGHRLRLAKKDGK